MSEDAQMPQSSRLLKPLFLSLLAVVIVIAVSAAIAIPAIARANHREAMELNAQQDTQVLVDAHASLEDAAKRYSETYDAVAAFSAEQLEPANELISAKVDDLPSEEVTTFSNLLGDLNNQLEERAIEYPLDQSFDSSRRQAALTASYLDADEADLVELRKSVSDEADEYAQQAEQLTDSAQDLEKHASASAEAFDVLLAAIVDEAATVLTENPKASQESRDFLTQLVELLEGNEAMPVSSSGFADAAFTETWLQATDAISKYPDAVQGVRDSHKKATAPKPKPKPTPPPSSGSDSSGAGSSGTCTWMEWGPLAPYWVWGPCSEMPK